MTRVESELLPRERIYLSTTLTCLNETMFIQTPSEYDMKLLITYSQVLHRGWM